MEHTLWKTMVVCCLAANFGAGSLFARGGGIGGGGGGGTAHVGGGAPHVGGGGAPHAGGGGTPHAGGGGGSPQLGGGSAPVHSSNGLQAAGASVSHLGGQQSLNHVPGGGQQNLGAQNLNLSNHTVISGSPQVGHHPGMNGTSTSGVGVSNQLGQAGHVGQNSQIHLGQSNLNGQTHLGNGLNSGVHGVTAGKVSEFHNSGISHQQFVGNTVNFGNRQINLGGAGYRPAYCRHEQFYHGHWNGNYGFPGYGHYGGYGWGGPGFGYGMYGYRPFFWGLGGWGLGSLVYGSGYVGYYNPYYYNTNAFSYGYNYAQPIPVVYNATNPAYSMTVS